MQTTYKLISGITKYYYHAMRSVERIIALSYCHDVRPSVHLPVWDGCALWSYGAS